MRNRKIEISRYNGYTFTLVGFSEIVDMLMEASLVAIEEAKSAYTNLGVPTVELVYKGEPYEVNIPTLKTWTKNRGSKTSLKHYERYLSLLEDPEYILVVKRKVY